MKWTAYLLDRKYLILFYIVLMAFITAVIFLDPAVKIWVDDILYLNVGSLFLFLLYLGGSYERKKKYYQQLQTLLQTQQNDLIYQLPEAMNYEQKIFQQLLIQMYSELSQDVERINAEKKENFEYICSWVHEMKTPLSVSSLIIENHRGKNGDQLLDSLEEEIKRMEKLVEQVLYYARLEDFSHDYLIHEVDIKTLVNETVKKHASLFINRKIGIEINMPGMIVATDKKWLLFILDQIILNSLKYTPPGGLIKIYAQKEEREKILIIEDNGIGIKAEDVGRVFERGFTGYNGREFAKSTGMGLYLVKKLARKLGHDVSIASVYGEYTRVIIHFPKLGDYLKP